jgi:HNH endonuclease
MTDTDTTLCQHCQTPVEVPPVVVKGKRGKDHWNWKGGTRLHTEGYVLMRADGHPRATATGRYVAEHILIAEHALGRSLPPQVEVHHVNEVRHDNRNGNLVICEDRAYHMLLHVRLRAYKATGCVTSVKCVYCKQWGSVGHEGMRQPHRRNGKPANAYHAICATNAGVRQRDKRRMNVR